MQYLLAGSVTFSSQTNRDAALTRVNSALLSYSYTVGTSVFPSGVNTSGTTVITFSLIFNDIDTANSCLGSVMAALTASNRHTSGWLSVGVYL